MFCARNLKLSLRRFWQWVTPRGYRPERRYMRGLPRESAG
jgi:hypothetical protein